MNTRTDDLNRDAKFSVLRLDARNQWFRAYWEWLAACQKLEHLAGPFAVPVSTYEPAGEQFTRASGARGAFWNDRDAVGVIFEPKVPA